MLLIVLDYISLNNNKLVCFVHSEGWFKIQDLVHQFVNKCRRDACFCMVQTCVESLNNVLKKLCTRLSDSFHPENYNNSDNNNIHMRNIYIHKGQGSPYWEGRAKSPNNSRKIAHSSPHLEKFPPVDFHLHQTFLFPTKIQFPPLNINS